MAMELRCESTDYRTELLSPMRLKGEAAAAAAASQSWRLDMSDFQMPEGPKDPSFVSRVFRRTHGKQSKIAKYYKKQEKLLQGFNEMEGITELGCQAGASTEDELRELEKSERMAINTSNVANLFLFAAKVYASIESKSLAVIASTLDSLLDLLSGFILWFTSYAMKKPNQYSYPIGKKRMQPVGIIVFASVMATLGFQVMLESGRELVTQAHPTFDHKKEKWMVGIMASVTIVKFVLMLYCRTFQNDIVRAYAQDHFFDVITNSIGLATALLAVRFYWWMDPVGAILIALYTISTWAKTVLENVWSLVGKTAPPDYLTKLTYLIWNHHEEIRHIDTVRAYTFGSHYFVEVDIVLPGNMPLSQAHDIGETLQEKLEQLPEVERAFVHIDFEFTHRPEHKTKMRQWMLVLSLLIALYTMSTWARTVMENVWSLIGKTAPPDFLAKLTVSFGIAMQESIISLRLEHILSVLNTSLRWTLPCLGICLCAKLMTLVKHSEKNLNSCQK